METEASPTRQQAQGVDGDASALITKGLMPKAAANAKPPSSAAPAAPAAPVTPAAPAASDSSEADSSIDNPQSGQEGVDELRDRVAKLEAERGQVERLREARDATDAFIREKMDDLPRAMVRKLMPATSDPRRLALAEQEVRSFTRQIVDAAVSSGRLRYVNLGGGDGGTPTRSEPLGLKLPAAELITAGLQFGPNQQLDRRS